MSGCEHGDEAGMWARDPGPYAPVSPPAVSSTLRDQLFVLSQSSSHGSTPSPPPSTAPDDTTGGATAATAAAAAALPTAHKVPTSRILPLKRPRRLLNNGNNAAGAARGTGAPTTNAGAATGGGPGRRVPPAAKAAKTSMSPVTVSVPPPQLFSLQRLARTAHFSQAMLTATKNAAQLGYGFPRGAPLRAPSPASFLPESAVPPSLQQQSQGVSVKREPDEMQAQMQGSGNGMLFAGPFDDSAVNYGGPGLGLMSPHGDPFALACGGGGVGGLGGDADTADGLFGALDAGAEDWAGAPFDLASPPGLRQRRRSGESVPGSSSNNNGCLLTSLDLACSTAMAGTAQGPGADTLGRAATLHARSGTAFAELSPSLSFIKAEGTSTVYQHQEQVQEQEQQQQQQQQEFSPPPPAQRTMTARGAARGEHQHSHSNGENNDENDNDTGGMCGDCSSSDAGNSCGGCPSEEMGYDAQPQQQTTTTTVRHAGPRPNAGTTATTGTTAGGNGTVLVSSAPMYGHGFPDMAAARADVLGLVGATLGPYIDLTHPASIVPEVIQPMVYVNARVLRCPMRGGRSLTCCQPFLLMHIHSARDCWMKSTCHVEDGYAVVSGMRFNWLLFRDELRKLTLAFVARPPVRLRPVQPLGGVETLALMPPLRFLGATPDAVCARLWDLFKSMPRTFKQLDPVQPSSADLLGVLANDIHPWFSRCGVCVPLPWENYFRTRVDWPDNAPGGGVGVPSSSSSVSSSSASSTPSPSMSSTASGGPAAGPPEEAGLAKVVALVFFSFVCSRAFCMDTTLLIDSLQQRGGVTGSMGTSASVRSATPAPRRVARSSLNGALRRSVSAGNLAPARTAAPPPPSVLEPSEPQPLRAVVAAQQQHHHHHHSNVRRPRSALATSSTTVVVPSAGNGTGGAVAAGAAAVGTAQEETAQ